MNTSYHFQEWVLAHAADLQVNLFFLLFAILALTENLTPARRGREQTKRRWMTNLLLTLLNIGLMALLPVSFFTVAVWAARNGIGLLNMIPMPFWALLVVGLLLRGFISFLTHLLMHKVPLLWRVHRVHHLDTEMDVSTTVRFHPLELVLNLGPGILFVVILGLPPWLLLFYEVLDAGVTVFSHANTRLPRRLEGWLRFVIVTPDLHRVHHSSHQPETDSNYGAVFPIWDMVFGTFRTRTAQPMESMTLGLDEIRDERSGDVRWLLASPLKRTLESDGREDGRVHE